MRVPSAATLLVLIAGGCSPEVPSVALPPRSLAEEALRPLPQNSRLREFDGWVLIHGRCSECSATQFPKSFLRNLRNYPTVQLVESRRISPHLPRVKGARVVLAPAVYGWAPLDWFAEAPLAVRMRGGRVVTLSRAGDLP